MLDISLVSLKVVDHLIHTVLQVVLCARFGKVLDANCPKLTEVQCRLLTAVTAESHYAGSAPTVALPQTRKHPQSTVSSNDVR